MIRLICAFVLTLLVASVARAGGLEVARACYRDTNASLHLFLINSGNQAVSLLPPVVNGFDCASLGRKEDRPRDVLWYRCRPNPIPPGGMADLIVVLPRRTDKPAVIELSASSGQKLRKAVRCEPEQVRFQAIRFSRDLRTVDVYIRSAQDLRFRRLRMDGKAVGRSFESFHGLAFARISLDKPLASNSWHVFEAEADGGQWTAYQIRAVPAEFLVGVYGTPSPEHIADWASHGVNHYLAFGSVSGGILDALRQNGISVGAKYIAEPLTDRAAGKVAVYDDEAARTALSGVAGNPGLLYHHLVDEPDVSDYYIGRFLGGSGMELAARAAFFEEHDPGRYTFVQLDNTFRPDNYRVYGESADLLATHRYSLGNYLRSEAGESTVKSLPFLEDMEETLGRFRVAVEPRPFFMVTQFFNLGPGRAGRPPTIEEMRLQCYLMVGGGARGLVHYIHSGSTGGGEGGRTPALWDAMTGLHEELLRVGETVASGTPAPDGWVACSSPNILARALLCGNEMAAVLVNRAHRSSLDRFTAAPTRGVNVSIRVPPWIDASTLEARLADDGSEPPTVLANGLLTLRIDQVKDARCVLIRRK